MTIIFQGLRHHRTAICPALMQGKGCCEVEALAAVPKRERHETRQLSTEEAYLEWKLALAAEPVVKAAEEAEKVYYLTDKEGLTYVQIDQIYTQLRMLRRTLLENTGDLEYYKNEENQLSVIVNQLKKQMETERLYLVKILELLIQKILY